MPNPQIRRRPEGRQVRWVAAPWPVGRDNRKENGKLQSPYRYHGGFDSHLRESMAGRQGVEVMVIILRVIVREVPCDESSQ